MLVDLKQVDISCEHSHLKTMTIIKEDVFSNVEKKWLIN